MGSRTGVQELAAVKRQAATGGTCPVAGTPPFPGLRGRLPGRVSREWNVVTPLGSGLRFRTGKPTVRKADILSGSGMAQEANAGGRKASGSRGVVIAPPAVAPDNRPDTGAARPERGLTWAG